MGPKWVDFGVQDPDLGWKWVQNGTHLGHYTRPRSRGLQPDHLPAADCEYVPIRPIDTLRVALSVWPLAGPARDLNMDPEMGPNWGI